MSRAQVLDFPPAPVDDAFPFDPPIPWRGRS